MRPVYLRGAGLASALGPDRASAVHALRTGASPRMRRHAGLDWPVHALWDGEVPDSEDDWLARARETVCAVAHESGALDTSRSGPLFVASSSRDIGAREQALAWHGDTHAFSERVAQWLDWRGPVFSVFNACTSAVQAVLSAQRCIAAGECEQALVLGLELPNRYTVAGLAAMQLLAPDRAQPCGVERAGLVVGEAVAALYLGAAPSRWRIDGGACVVGGSNPAGLEPQALSRALDLALERSGLQAHDIDLVKMHAAGSGANDALEAALLTERLGAAAPWVTLKPSLGHSLGAAGAAELALVAACQESGVWPRLHYQPDPAVAPRLGQVPASAAHRLLLLFAGFGGGHAALVATDLEAH
ncbi:MAG: beta-ketoacyl synthase [Proteobacteria bacterium]|nr:beta-ketoacyl synthase [Pseudomonadota bacterium]